MTVLPARTRRLLEAPIAPTLLRLAAPNVAITVVQSAVAAFDVFFVASLGAEAIAGVSLVFPLVMLMQAMSTGGMGSAVASAVARALGGGRRTDADALARHGLALALAFGAAFTAGALLLGPPLYGWMGGSGGALTAARAYSTALFAGAIAPWTFNVLANVVRGTGNMVVPATLIVGAATLHLALSPSLIFGLGPLPRLGVAGAGVAMVVATATGALLAAAYLRSGRSLVTLGWARSPFRGRLFRDILRVGIPGAFTTVTASATLLGVTAYVGRFGTAALAGYGIGSRLEFLQIPIVFGMGAALVAMVATNVGAGQRPRAERVAWTGAAFAAGVTGAIGLVAAAVPSLWMRIFTAEPAVVAVGSTYLRLVGPVYGVFGGGLALYFASQGAGRLFWPVIASLARLVVAVGGGALVVVSFGGGLHALFAVLAASVVVFGGINAAAIKAGAWR